VEGNIIDAEISYINYRFISIPGNDVMRYVTEIEGDIFACDNDGTEHLVGKVKYVSIDANDALDNGISPEYLLDIQSNTSHFMGELYNRSGCYFRRKIQNLFISETLNTNLLIVDRIEILPFFRGRSWFSKIINDGIRFFGFKAELIVLKAFPLQFEINTERKDLIEWQTKMSIDKLCSDEKTAFRKIERFYRGAGFVKISNSGIMIKPIEQIL